MAGSSEFIVNSITASSQRDPVVTGLADGGFVVTWETNDVDGDRYGIAAQIYNADGSMQGGEFLVNTYTTQAQDDPVVAALNDGGFVIVWDSVHQSASVDIFAQIYNADGTPRGGELAMTGSYRGQVVTPLQDGGFLLGWDTAGLDVAAQRYDANGVAVGSAFLINTDTANNQSDLSFTQLGNGKILATWTSYVSAAVGNEIRAQMINPDGTLHGAEFSINSYQTSHQHSSEIAALEDGGFVVTWVSNGQDGSVNGVYARVYDANGSARTGELLVTPNPHDAEDRPQIIGMPDGRFMITWREANHDSVNKSYILGQVFNADGSKSGGWFEVNQSELEASIDHDLAVLGDGRVVATWTLSDANTVGQDVYARILAPEPQGTSGGDELEGSIYNDRIFGFKGADLIEGFKGRDRLEGGKGHDTLEGGKGHDTLIGGTGDDSILGGKGADRIIGGKGDDTLTGGDKGDSFRFRLGDGDDEITDFDLMQDSIRFIDTGLGQGDLSFAQIADDLEVSLGDVTILLHEIDLADQGSIDFSFV